MDNAVIVDVESGTKAEGAHVRFCDITGQSLPVLMASRMMDVL